MCNVSSVILLQYSSRYIHQFKKRKDAKADFNLRISGQQVCFVEAGTEIDICRIVLSIATSSSTETYVCKSKGKSLLEKTSAYTLRFQTEVWLPPYSNDSSAITDRSTGDHTAWNGRLLATDNKGLGGCEYSSSSPAWIPMLTLPGVSYDDMAYTSSLGFAVVGDNGGHNSSAYDGSGFYENNNAVVDWAYRSRHAAVVAAKQVVQQYYSQAQSYTYYLGCSTGGAQGLKSAQVNPDDFDGIIAGSPAADTNHLQDWSGVFVLKTGLNTSDPRFLTLDQWTLVHTAVLAQCEPLDGVYDGILEDSTICNFNASTLLCEGAQNASCLTSTQVNTVYDIYTPLYDQNGLLLFPGLPAGAELDCAQQEKCTGSIQGLTQDWYRYLVYNDSSFDALTLNQTDFTVADDEDAMHGNVSSFSGDLSAWQASGGKMIMYHGLADSTVTGENSQRYYLHVAQTMNLSNTDMDEFLRFFRISGGAHCFLGGPGAWEFGQSEAARDASDNIIWDLVDWVENGVAPVTLNGTKFINDTVSEGIAFERPHCRFPYRTTYLGGGLNPNVTSSWTCDFIDDWQDCGPDVLETTSLVHNPRLCGSYADPTYINDR